jgi:hypothetical protein
MAMDSAGRSSVSQAEIETAYSPASIEPAVGRVQGVVRSRAIFSDFHHIRVQRRPGMRTSSGPMMASSGGIGLP